MGGFPVGDERTSVGRLRREASGAGWLSGLGAARPGGLDAVWQQPARGEGERATGPWPVGPARHREGGRGSLAAARQWALVGRG
jgi:hypothetical protein